MRRPAHAIIVRIAPMGGGYRGGMHLEQNGHHFRSARAPHDCVGSEVQRRAPVVTAAVNVGSRSE